MGRALFHLGSIYATPGAIVALEEAGQGAHQFLGRHQRGDWGDVCAEDAYTNNESLRKGYRLLSAYRTHLGERLWIITEGDRSATTILTPEEY